MLACLSSTAARAKLDIDNRGPVLDAGALSMRVTNAGILGNAFFDHGLSFDPSLEFPRGSGHELLGHAELWVGAVRLDGSTRVSGGPPSGDRRWTPTTSWSVRTQGKRVRCGISTTMAMASSTRIRSTAATTTGMAGSTRTSAWSRTRSWWPTIATMNRRPSPTRTRAASSTSPCIWPCTKRRLRGPSQASTTLRASSSRSRTTATRACAMSSSASTPISTHATGTTQADTSMTASTSSPTASWFQRAPRALAQANLSSRPASPGSRESPPS